MSLKSMQLKYQLSSKQLLMLESEVEKRKPSTLLTYFLWLGSSFGIFALHRFYLHDYKKAILMFVTLGGCFIWGITDIFRIDNIISKRIEQLEEEIIDEIRVMETFNTDKE